MGLGPGRRLRLWAAGARCRIDVVHREPARPPSPRLAVPRPTKPRLKDPRPAVLRRLVPRPSSPRPAGPARFAALLLLGAALLAGCSGPGAAPDAAAGPAARASSDPRPTWTPPAGTDLADRARYAAALEDGVNAARAQLGVRPLEHDDCLAAVAEDRAAALVGVPELVHAPLPTVQRRCPGGTIAAENLSRTDRPPQDVVQAWLDSPTHRDNLVSADLLRGAIGCVRDGGTDGAPVLVCSHVFLG